jgi:hypothetical protein
VRRIHDLFYYDKKTVFRKHDDLTDPDAGVSLTVFNTLETPSRFAVTSINEVQYHCCKTCTQQVVTISLSESITVSLLFRQKNEKAFTVYCFLLDLVGELDGGLSCGIIRNYAQSKTANSA